MPGSWLDLRAGKSVADLAPAPQFEAAWIAHPTALFDLMLAAAGQTVRQWCVRMLRMHHTEWMAQQPVATLLRLADHEEPALSDFGFDLLEKASDLETVPVEEWLKRLDGNDLAKLQRLSALLSQRFDPGRVATVDALRLAAYRSKPVAELGFAILRNRLLGPEEVITLLPLVQAESHRFDPKSSAGCGRNWNPVREESPSFGMRLSNSSTANMPMSGRLAGLGLRNCRTAMNRPSGNG